MIAVISEEGLWNTSKCDTEQMTALLTFVYKY